MGQSQAIPRLVETPQVPYTVRNESFASGVSWAAVSSGAFVTMALFWAFSALGAGVGLSSISPWSNTGPSPTSLGAGAVIWLCVIEIISCAFGGYVAGRLRSKWVEIHSDEVYFRDTAHGFLVWAVAFVVSIAFLASAASVMAGGNRNARFEGANVDASRYYVDGLFRTTQPSKVPDDSLRSEVATIFAHAIGARELSDVDKNYLADLVTAHAGVARPEAEKRVTEDFSLLQQSVDATRKAIAHSLYWLFVALLLGAFSASFAATFGGKQRDHAHLTRA